MRHALFLLLFVANSALALEVCWQAPTENVDGTPITAIPLDHTIYYGTTSGVYDETPIVTGEPGDGCHTWQPTPNIYFLVMTATDADGDESGYSNEISKTEDAPVITLPPVILANDEVVYTVIKQPDRFLLLPIGTVPAGTECDPNNSVNGHGAVPNEAVVWTSPTGSRPIVVVARCNG